MAPSLLLPLSRPRPSSMFMFLSPSAYIPHSPNAPHSWKMVPENTNSQEEKTHLFKADRIITVFVQWPLKELLKVGLSIQPAPDVLLADPIPTMLLWPKSEKVDQCQSGSGGSSAVMGMTNCGQRVVKLMITDQFPDDQWCWGLDSNWQSVWGW